MIRSFFAVAVSEAVESQLIQRCKFIQPQLSRKVSRQPLRWVAAENFHITLAFLGDIREADLARLETIANSVIANHSPMSLHFTDVAWFPSANKPRMLVALPEANSSFKRLQAELNQQLRSHGFRVENRRFRPHITLARCPRGMVAEPMTETSLAIDLMIDQIVLLRSQLDPRGSRYTPLFAATLRV